MSADIDRLEEVFTDVCFEPDNSLIWALSDPRRAVVALLQAIREPSEAQLRALLIHRGYDPDAKEETLDTLGNLDVMTMGAFVRAYTAMIDGLLA